MSFEQNADDVSVVDESHIELMCESGCVTLHERDWNINRHNQVLSTNREILIIGHNLHRFCY